MDLQTATAVELREAQQRITDLEQQLAELEAEKEHWFKVASAKARECASLVKKIKALQGGVKDERDS